MNETGKRVAQLMKGMGVKIVIADRKAAISQTDEPEFVEDDLESPKRTSFKSVLRNCTSIVLTCPLTPETKNLISEAELVAMRPDAIVVNVARGGVVDEAAIAKALNQERISGYATDVFSKEPASSEDNPLLRDLKDDAHFLASPHVAWFSETTIVNLSKILKDNVELWLAGTPQNVIV
jgi:lactate dehydrogenase-like 2-hydroxyacid dehydrogenase